MVGHLVARRAAVAALQCLDDPKVLSDGEVVRAGPFPGATGTAPQSPTATAGAPAEHRCAQAMTDPASAHEGDLRWA